MRELSLEESRGRPAAHRYLGKIPSLARRWPAA